MRVQISPSDLPALSCWHAAVALVERLPFEVNLWRVQNLYAELVHGPQAEIRRRAAQGNSIATDWCRLFDELGLALKVRLDARPAQSPQGSR